MAAAATSPMLPALLLLIAFAAATTGAAETSALDHTCAMLGEYYYVEPELCKSVLCADPSEPCHATRDQAAVAMLAARLAVRNATATKGLVEAALAAHAGNATVAKGIESCVQLYAGVVAILQRAAQFVAAGRYREAGQVLNANPPIVVPDRCDGAMGAGDAAALLPRENDAFAYMALVAHSIINNMKSFYFAKYMDTFHRMMKTED
ncbi:hypothetical protein EJB05_00604, partial [Eragrostis curvula]